MIDNLDRYSVPYVGGRYPRGDNLDQLKEKLRAWLRDHATEHNVLTNRTRVEELCRLHGHPKPLMTPPYHPELQPITGKMVEIICNNLQ